MKTTLVSTLLVAINAISISKNISKNNDNNLATLAAPLEAQIDIAVEDNSLAQIDSNVGVEVEGYAQSRVFNAGQIDDAINGIEQLDLPR